MNRREFTKLAGKCVVCAGATSLIPGCKTASELVVGTINKQGAIVVSRDKLAKGTPNLLIRHPNNQFPISLLAVDTNKFSACLMRCTHQQCQTVYTDAQYTCPCHGARFTHTGTVVKGPATNNLTCYPVEVNDREIRILIG